VNLGLSVQTNGIVATSMMLLDHERCLIEKVFGVPVTNRYGCEEVSLIACECELHQGMHINAEHVIVEFLRDDGSPCSSGEDGRLVITEFVNFGMPMIRYEVGDRGVPGERVCNCGRGLPMLENISGRVADFLVAEDGSRVAGISLIENTLTKYPGIQQMQLIQNQPLTLEVNLVPASSYCDEVQAALEATLEQALGKSISITVKVVTRIPQEDSGKYRFSICRI